MTTTPQPRDVCFSHQPSCLYYLLLLMSHPKTPSRYRARSEVKTPLTPSLINGTPSKSTKRSKSHSNPGDNSNPFVSKSRPVSPVKRATSGGLAVSESLSRQASGGVIRKGGVESRLDVVTRDYIPPPSQQSNTNKSEVKRSKSIPAAVSLHIILQYHTLINISDPSAIA